MVATTEFDPVWAAARAFEHDREGFQLGWLDAIDFTFPPTIGRIDDLSAVLSERELAALHFVTSFSYKLPELYAALKKGVEVPEDVREELGGVTTEEMFEGWKDDAKITDAALRRFRPPAEAPAE